MRRILLLAHKVPTRGEFTLNDLAGGGGRMDEVARAVSTAFTLSNDLRRDTEMTVLFVADPAPAARKIELVGARLRYLNPDERSTAALLKNALTRAANHPHVFESSPGVRVGPVDAAAALAGFLQHPGVLWLRESGAPIATWRPADGDVAAVVSDPFDPTPEEMAILDGSAALSISVGPRSFRTSQVIDAFQREVDLRPTDPPPSTD